MKFKTIIEITFDKEKDNITEMINFLYGFDEIIITGQAIEPNEFFENLKATIATVSDDAIKVWGNDEKIWFPYEGIVNMKKAINIGIGDSVVVSDPKHEDSLHEHSYIGTVVGIKIDSKGSRIIVKDQEGFEFGVDLDEIQEIEGKNEGN